ncbi:MAG: ceramidase domain-containing protein [Pseudomonadota bacterium]
MNDFIDAYCERLDAGFWAEPVNALTNAAFFIAAYLLYRQLRGTGDHAALALTALVALIGVGSFLFHIFATRWAAIADVLPIMLFMLASVAIGLQRRFGLSGQYGALGAIVFFLSGVMIGFSPLVTVIPGGSAGYLPALVTLGLFALFLARRGDAFARFFLLAAPVFALSLTLRTLDMPLCEALSLGTHFTWHMLNAVTLYLVTRGLMRDGAIGARAE